MICISEFKRKVQHEYNNINTWHVISLILRENYSFESQLEAQLFLKILFLPLVARRP